MVRTLVERWTDMWHEGTIGAPVNGKMIACHYWVKTYTRNSKQYGLEGGKISKVTIRIGGTYTCNYDRGWDIEPSEDDEATQIALAILIKEYN